MINQLKILFEKKYGFKGATVFSEEMKLKEDMGLDSLDLVDLLIDVENVFGIILDENDLDPAKLQTIGDILHIIKTKNSINNDVEAKSSIVLP